jgi:DeoR family transcriptional regulator, aga operon transcriptional repressor
VHGYPYNAGSMSKGTTQRRDAILEILNRDGFTSVPALTKELGFSHATIRRDLVQLDRNGRIRRTYGGAIAAGGGEVPYRDKLTEEADAKTRIARVAAGLVQPGQAVGFTGGTTTLFVARHLPRDAQLTVVTNALNIAMEMAGFGVRIIVTGGELRDTTYELVGPLAEPVLQHIHLDLVFVGVDGISPDGGLTTHNPVEAQTNRWLIERAARVVVVADARKLGRRTFAQIVQFDRAELVITDSGATREQRAALEQAGLAVMVAE